MKPKTMILMVVAVGCGLGASYMTSKLLADRGKAPAPVETVDVVVAKTRVPSWQPIKEPEKQFEVKKYLPESAPKNPISDLNELKDQRFKTFIEEGQPISKDNLVSKDDQGLGMALKNGQRATTIRVTVESGVHGFVLPGSHVDVICTLREDKSTKLILQNMLVLATDAVAKDDKDPAQKTIQAQTVTLAAFPEEGARLALAQSMGELRLWLRHPGDEARLPPLSVSRADLDKPLPDPTEVKEKETPEEKSTPSGKPTIDVPPDLDKKDPKEEKADDVAKAKKAKPQVEEEEEPLPQIKIEMTPRQPPKWHKMHVREGSRIRKEDVAEKRDDGDATEEATEETAPPAPVKKEEKPEPRGKIEQPPAAKNGSSTKTNRTRTPR